jgi:2-dehydro-3-deoxyphosphogluconate aldolase/(4S)-4-hydroxy-2-oxoglutarate aldolase
MNQEFTKIEAIRLLPIVVIDKAEHAATLGEILASGGLPLVEVTFRTPVAESAVRTLAQRGDLLVGAGTILTTEQADRAIDAGAKFLVTPGTNPKVIEHVLKRGLAIVPGVATPTEIELATSLGAEVLKFFPAETMGGVGALKAFAGPYPHARFIPTGGITPELLPGYLRLSSVVACGGSWMAPRELLAASRFDAIAALVEDAKKILSGPPEIAT